MQLSHAMSEKSRKFIIEGLNDYDCKPGGTMEVWGESVSDGYHTMHELYQHRMALNIALWHALDRLYTVTGLDDKTPIHPRVFKSKNHHPTGEPMFEGYFIVFCTIAELNGAWCSYHYQLKHWDEFRVPETAHSPLFPMNHEDAIEFFGRLMNFDRNR